jgi:hypothetical protein
MYAAAGAIALLALISLVLATMRKRGPREVVKVVETYSQWIRRRSGEGNRKRSGVPTRAQGAAADLPPAELDDGWVLSGQDVKGNPVRMVVGKTELEQASKGNEKGLIIGRSNALASKIMADSSVSRRHARLVLEKDGLALEDLNSTYGTKVNGTKLAPYKASPITEGDKLMLGDVKLTLAKK